MNKKILSIICLTIVALSANAQDNNDFGLDLNVGAEKKITKGISFGLEGTFTTQNDFKDVERYAIGGAFDFKIINTKKFDLKASIGWEYIWQNILSDTNIKKDSTKIITDQHWRNRHRTTIAFTGIYHPSKRWQISLKEAVQYNHYCTYTAMVSSYDYKHFIDGWHYGEEPDEGPDNITKKNKDRFILRSRVAVQYNIKHSIFSPYAMVDYGCGLNYSTNKWKVTAGTDIDITKSSGFDVYYRFQTEDDDDEPNGHMLGIGYKFKF